MLTVESCNVTSRSPMKLGECCKGGPPAASYHPFPCRICHITTPSPTRNHACTLPMPDPTPDFNPQMYLIRPAKIGDECELAALLLRARRATFHWRDPESFTLGDFALETAGEQIWVAEAESGRLAGFISVWMPEHFIHHLYVHPDLQRSGLGTLLLNTMLSSVKAPWSLKCAIKNVPAVAFYEKMGWTIVGRGEDIGSDYYLMHAPTMPEEPVS